MRARSQIPTVGVFLSSTWLDLQPERKAVEEVLQRMISLAYVGMEYFGSRPESANEVSLEEVAASDLYVGIIGGRYGSGITEAEYRKAREDGLPCYFYFKKDAAITEEQRDAEPERREKLEQFKAAARDSFGGHIVTWFSTPDELAARVGPDLHNWLFKQYLVPSMQSAVHEGRFGAMQQLLARTQDVEALRAALREAGIAVGDDVVDALLVLGGERVVERFVHGVRALRTDYAGRIQNYLLEYLGTPEKPVPFGGRAHALAALDGWLDAAEAPYLLLAAPAGRGKSAVLVRWSRRLLTRDDLTVIFLPISIRFRTNLGSVVFASLAAQLATFFGEEVPQQANVSVEVWRGLVTDYLSRPLPEGQQLLVILDGLDEAADWEAGPDLFPYAPPERLRVVVSARFTSYAPEAAAWRGRLGWDGPRATLAHDLTLAPLDAEGVADVLMRMGFPLNDLGQNVDLVAELHRLSEGDPLLVWLYVQDLWARGHDAARLRPEDLQTLRRGLDGYFDRWWEEQRRLWGDTAPLKEQSVQVLMNMLACAHGPLTRDDVLELAPEESGLVAWTLDDALEPLARFIVGNGEEIGYVFSHPRFGMYLSEKLAPRDRRRWQERFLAWGQGVLDGLGTGEVAPDEVPAYLLQYYSTHLEEAGAGPEAFLALTSRVWKEAWEVFEGGYAGFVSDVDRAWRVLARHDRAEAEAGRPMPYLKDEILCALLRTSVNALAGNMHPFLIERLVAEGVWKPAQGLANARHIPAAFRRVEALGLLARHLPPRLRAEVEQEALEAAASFENAQHRAQALVILITTPGWTNLGRDLEVLDEVRNHTLSEFDAARIALVLADRGAWDAALEMAQRTSGSDGARLRAALHNLAPIALEGLARRACTLGQPDVAQQIADEVPEAEVRGRLHAQLAMQLAALGRFEEARTFLEGISDLQMRADLQRFVDLVERVAAEAPGLAVSADHLPLLAAALRVADSDDHPHFIQLLEPVLTDEARDALADFVATIAQSDGAESVHVISLLALMTEAQRDVFVAATLEEPGGGEPARRGALPMLRLARAISPTTLPRFLEVTASLQDYERGPVLEGVAQELARRGDVEAALQVFRNVDKAETRATMLAGILPHLPEAVQRQVVPEVLQALRPDVLGEAPDGLGVLSPHLSGPLLEEALHTSRRIGDISLQAIARVAVSPELQTLADDERLGALLRDIFSLSDEKRGLGGLAALFAGPALQEEVIGRLLDTTAQETADDDFIQSLLVLATFLEAGARRRIQAFVWDRLSAPEEVVAFLGESSEGVAKATLVDYGGHPYHALRTVARQILDGPEKLGGLAALLPLAPSHERAQRAEEVIALVEDNFVASTSIAAMLQYLPPQRAREVVAGWWQAAERADSLGGMHYFAEYLEPAHVEHMVKALLVARPGGEEITALVGLLPYMKPATQAAALQVLTQEDRIDALENSMEELVTAVFFHPRRDQARSMLNEMLTPQQGEKIIARLEEGEIDLAPIVISRFLEPLISGAAPDVQMRIVQHMLRPERTTIRRRLLIDLAAYASIVQARGDEGVLGGVRDAIEYACELFP